MKDIFAVRLMRFILHKGNTQKKVFHIECEKLSFKQIDTGGRGRTDTPHGTRF